MNRRNLIQLAGALVVGEPARRAYSFLNGYGIESSREAIRRELLKYYCADAAYDRVRHLNASGRVSVWKPLPPDAASLLLGVTG